ncbi:MAG: FAD binding domain-containing protein [Candidatus Sabulitectum sp.]|nr:FAD binding domain-containing protein [Candidatus Sabulitectum sp.]
MISFICNNKEITVDCPGGLPVLDWIRSQSGLKGTKEGCREGDCGACTVVVGRPGKAGIEYSAVCSCLLPIGEIAGCHLVTIEGLSSDERHGGNDELTPFQRSFYDEAASQCGFCTPGMIMSLTGCLLGSSELSVSAAMESLDGNICRCTGYIAVKRAVDAVMNELPLKCENRLEMLIDKGHVPSSFNTISERLKKLPVCEDSTDGTVIAGGTDIYVHSSDRLSGERPEFLSRRDDLNFIHTDHELVRIGSSVTFSQLRESTVLSGLFPNLKSFLSRVSSTQIRSRATVGGNIVNASPIADLAIVFLALNASVTISQRSVPLSGFYLGYKKLYMQPGEILTEVSFPVPERGSVLSSLKVCKREYLDIASVNSSMLFRVKDDVILSARVSAGGVSPIPLLLVKTGEYLCGKTISEETIKEACLVAAAEISPISDVRGAKEYKNELLKAQIRAHLTRRVRQ